MTPLTGASLVQIGAGVGLVHDHQFGTGPQELLSASIALDVVGGDDRVGITIEQGLVPAAVPLQASRSARKNQDGVEVLKGESRIMIEAYED